MTTFDKLNIIDTLTEPFNVSTVGNQSLKVSFDCGCNFIQHSYSGNSRVNPEINKPQYDRISADRGFFVTLCRKHR